MYTPNPVNTDTIALPEALQPLGEQLAENVHRVWMEGRLADGWTYGPARDDEKKQHPCLVPYAELPESEKDYDRNTAFGTVKLILALGYGIIPAAAPVEGFPAELSVLREQIARHVHDIWSLGRLAEGWTYGPARDDEKKQHPCLVPYAELPDSEKEYDRNTAFETINMILEAGYEIKRAGL